MKTLRKHQKEAIVEINNHDEGIIHLPTASGKTYIQATAIIDNIDNAIEWVHTTYNTNEVPVFVILSPRIVLSNQLYNEVKKDLVFANKDCQYLIVHSGRTKDNRPPKNLPFRQLKSTTKTHVIKKEYQKAKLEKVPLIVFGTYDSAERIVNSGIPVYMLLNDEAQYLVSEEFGWIPKENENPEIKQFNAKRKYYFTATLKETASDDGVGMNNESLFGPILYCKEPITLIKAGEILRPRMHLVNIENVDDNDEITKDANCVKDSFIEHKAQCNVGAKLLVVTKGSTHLDNLVNSDIIKNLLETRPSLTIFDISSQFSPRINGSVVSREHFLNKLQSLTDVDDAIIFHINILSEGIDVPGITGVMIMNNMKLSKFLQTLGRATRLHGQDRTKLYDNTLEFNELRRFIKPYAWVIIPVYDVIGHDLKEQLSEIIYGLRSYGFKAAEDVVIKQIRGSQIPQPLGGINETDTRAQIFHNVLVQLVHDIETKEKADRLAISEFNVLNFINNLF